MPQQIQPLLALLLMLACCSSPARTEPDADATGNNSTRLRILIQASAWEGGAPPYDELRLLVDDNEASLTGPVSTVLDTIAINQAVLELLYGDLLLDSYPTSVSDLCSSAIAQPKEVEAVICLKSNGELALASSRCVDRNGQTETTDFYCAPRCSPFAQASSCTGKCGLFSNATTPPLGYLDCVPAGDLREGDSCLPGQCVAGTSCTDGICRQFCNAAHRCTSGTCTEMLTADSDISMCTPFPLKQELAAPQTHPTEFITHVSPLS